MSLEGIKKASAATGIIEHMQILINNLTNFSDTLEPNLKKELDIHIERLKGILELMVESDELPELITGKNLGRYMSQIERLGLGSEIVRLIDQKKYTIAQVAEQLGVSVVSVRNFVKYYNKLKPSERSVYHRPSLLDTTQSLDQLGTMIYKALARLENSSNQEAYVKCLGELRQAITSAAKIMEKVDAKREIERLKMVVLEILIDELPDKRREILARLQSAGAKYALPD